MCPNAHRTSEPFLIFMNATSNAWDGGLRPEAYLVTTSAKDTGSYRNGDEIVLVA